MNRDARISCRTTGAVRKGLEEYAQRENLSISAALEIILTGYFESCNNSADRAEKARHSIDLSTTSIPVKTSGPLEPGAENGAIPDMSLVGLAKASAMLLNGLAK